MLKLLGAIFTISLTLAPSAFCDEAPAPTTPKSIPAIKILTVTPAPELPFAFGHLAIQVNSIVYSYGFVNLQAHIKKRIFNPEGVLLDFLNEKLPAEKKKMRRPEFDRFEFQRPGTYRAIQEDRLNLTLAQAEKLLAAIKADFDAPGSYDYKNFSDNCATRVRDLVASAIGFTPDQAEAFGPGTRPSIWDIVKSSMDDAREANPTTHKIALLPFNIGKAVEEAIPMLLGDVPAKIGQPIPMTFDGGDDFEQKARAVDAGVMKTYPGNPLAQSFHDYFFNPRYSDTSLTYWELAFTPKRVHELFEQVVNPENGRPLLIPGLLKESMIKPLPLPTPLASPEPQL